MGSLIDQIRRKNIPRRKGNSTEIYTFIAFNSYQLFMPLHQRGGRAEAIQTKQVMSATTILLSIYFIVVFGITFVFYRKETKEQFSTKKIEDEGSTDQQAS